MKKILCFISMTLLAGIFLVAGAYALPISDKSDVSGASEARDGIPNDTNNQLSDLNGGLYWCIDCWVDLQKFDFGDPPVLTTVVDIGLVVTPSDQAKTGTYEFNKSAWNTYSDMMIVLKDGGIEDGGIEDGDKYYWFAYLLNDGNFSGTWTYPEGKEISHLSVYGSTTGVPVPEPATILLLGAGLLGLVGYNRKRLIKKA